jgi:hypothetical protein
VRRFGFLLFAALVLYWSPSAAQAQIALDSKTEQFLEGSWYPTRFWKPGLRCDRYDGHSWYRFATTIHFDENGGVVVVGGYDAVDFARISRGDVRAGLACLRTEPGVLFVIRRKGLDRIAISVSSTDGSRPASAFEDYLRCSKGQ